MIFPFLTLSTVLAAVAPAVDMTKPPEVAAMRAVKLAPRSEWTLKNGLTVVFVEDRRMPLVTARLSLPGGQAAFAAEDAGLADALAELLTDGTARRTSKQISESAELFGGAIAVDAKADAIVAQASSLADKASLMASLLSEIVREPSFPEAEVALRKANMKEELAASLAESRFLAKTIYHGKIFKGHPYAITRPTQASIARLTRERIVAAHKRLFTPRGAILVLVGDLSKARAEALVEENFGSWIGGPAVSDAPAVAAATRARTVYLHDRAKSSQVSFYVGNSGLREDDPSYFDLLLANHVLGGSFSSRLMTDIRETKGYTYGIYSGLEHRLAGSLFTINWAARTEVAGLSLAAVLDNINALRGAEVSAAELKQAKTFLAAKFARSLETQEGVADAVLTLKLMRLPSDWHDTYVERVQAVSAASLLRAAQAFIRSEQTIVVAVGDAAKVKDALAKLSVRPIVLVDQDGN